MRHQLPALLFLVPLFAAISMPVVCLRHRGASRKIALSVLSIMAVLSVMNLINIFQHGEVRYAFSGWAPPLGIEWVADGLASIMMVALSFLGLVTLIFAGPTSPKDLGGRIVHFYTLILLLISSLTGIVFAGDLFNPFRLFGSRGVSKLCPRRRGRWKSPCCGVSLSSFWNLRGIVSIY